MTFQRQSATWAGAALLGVGAMVAALVWGAREFRRDLGTQVPPNPVLGAALFRDKGCAGCHDRYLTGIALAPDLREQPSSSSLPRLVTAMWNHAPRMWEAMHRRNQAYPSLTYAETGHLISYLYLNSYTDSPGDPVRGKALFETEQCARCHDPEREKSKLGITASPALWTQVLWNHAAGMNARMQELGIPWPQLRSTEINDLFAYLDQDAEPAASAPALPPGDPDRGWTIFQQKGCIVCHTLSRDQGPAGAVFIGGGSLPPTFSQFGEAMLNHFPEMQRTMKKRGLEPPRFNAQEMADLTIFIYGLHYTEPGGSPQIGASVFVWRGCGRCHGNRAEGTWNAPQLRSRGQTFTSIRLASDLWRHGAKMYAQATSTRAAWPVLQEQDIGDLLAFLNTPLADK